MNTTAAAPVAIVKSLAFATQSEPWILDNGQEAFGVFVEDDETGEYTACFFTGSWRECAARAAAWNATAAAGKIVRLPGGITLVAR